MKKLAICCFLLNIYLNVSFFYAAEKLFKEAEKQRREKKLLNELKTVFEEISKKAAFALSDPAEKFIGHIVDFDADRLEGFPDNWSWKKKACYLFSVIAQDSSKVRIALQKLKFNWSKGKASAIHPILRNVIDYGPV